MNDSILTIFVTSFVLLTILASVALIARRMRTQRDAGSDVILQRGPDGEIAVPVTGTFKGSAKNSLYPSLTITPEGLRFKVLREDRWPFAELERVEVGRTLFGGSLTFVSRRSGVLVAHVASADLARQTAAALPAGIPVMDRTAGRPEA